MTDRPPAEVGSAAFNDPAEPTVPKRQWRRRVLAFGSGLVVAIVYAMVTQYIFRSVKPGNNLGVLSLGFLAGVPFVIGFVTLCLANSRDRHSAATILLGGWPACCLLGFLTILFNWDATICILMAMPILFLCSTIGGAAAWLCVLVWENIVGTNGSSRTYGLAFLPLLLPYIATPLEYQVTPANDHRLVHNEIVIHAPRARVWPEVVEVPTITDQEWRNGWTTIAGLPAPRAATLSGQGVGAVRHANFANGLTFLEEVVEWQEDERIRFTIKVDRSHPVPKPFGAIGGPNFAVIDGTYTLHDRPYGSTLLVLESTERVTTHFNAYAGWWTDQIMGDMQARILDVIRLRAESPPIIP